MRFISLFASFGHNFKYSSSSHIFLSCPIPICDSHKFHPWSPLHFPSPRLRNLSRHTHDTRWHTNPRPTRRDIGVTDDRSPVVDFHGELILFLHRWFFFAPFFPTTFAVPLTNDYCLSEIRTATISHRVCLLLSTEVQRTSRSQHPSSFFSTLSPAPSSAARAFSFLSLKHGVSYFR